MSKLLEKRVKIGDLYGFGEVWARPNCPHCGGSGEVDAGGHYEECFGYHWVPYYEDCECLMFKKDDNMTEEGYQSYLSWRDGEGDYDDVPF